MKKLLFLAGALLITAGATATIWYSTRSNDKLSLLEQNIEVLANNEYEKGTIMHYVCNYFGCCGGDNKCFEGSVSFRGISASGTFFHN
jgi:hypothetical protein